MGDLLNSAESLEPLSWRPAGRRDPWITLPDRNRTAGPGLAVRPKGDNMSPLALNVFDVTIGLVLVSFAIWGFIITALTAWRGSAYSRVPIKLLRKWNR
jgi:hypothetical protein